LKSFVKVKIALDCANGVNFLHTCGIWHRDLKAENLLVESLAKKARIHVKLTDFGSSRVAKENSVEASYTIGIGTPIYISPEMLDKRVYNEKVDVYSYAILLLYLFTSSLPYKDFAHLWDVASFVTSGKRLPIPSSVPKGIQKIITDCWAHEPSQRPSFQQIVDDLQLLVNKKTFSVAVLKSTASSPTLMKEESVTKMKKSNEGDSKIKKVQEDYARTKSEESKKSNDGDSRLKKSGE